MKVKLKKSAICLPFLLFILVTIYGFVGGNPLEELNEQLKSQDISPIERGSERDTLKIELGRALFFDKILSGNKDISCATCHHPSLASADALSLSIGVGGTGLGSFREMGHFRNRIPRNSPEIFNRGEIEWSTMFWDGRLEIGEDGTFISPVDAVLAGGKLPEELDNILAAQAMFPVFSRDEMRGFLSDNDINGELNDLALISDAAPHSVWNELMNRILAFPEYKEMFEKVYPDIPLSELGFQHAANAIAAFEIDAFTFDGSPWDRYLRGEAKLKKSVLKGANLFYGKAGCADCHSGKLMTDQQYHNIGVPQIGPGKDNGKPYDPGRYLETGNVLDRFKFRTPPLRNVAITGPWFHNGAAATIESAIRYHLDPKQNLKNYEPDQLPAELQSTLKKDEFTINQILSTVDIGTTTSLTDKEIDYLVDFLNSLTDRKALAMNELVPERVPSGLPVDQIDDIRSKEISTSR